MLVGLRVSSNKVSGLMNGEPLGEVIASRQLEFTDRKGHKESVDVFLGRPVQYPDDGPWYCPCLIRGPRFERQFKMVGEDSMQALQLAYKSLKAELERLAREHKGAFTLSGEPDLGF